MLNRFILTYTQNVIAQIKLLRQFHFVRRSLTENKTMNSKQYNPPATFSCVNEVIDYLKETKGIRNESNFPMITIYIDDECLGFKSHKAAIKLLECVVSGTSFKAFRNFAKGLTLQALKGY